MYEIIFVNSKFIILMVVNNYNLSCESFQPHVSRRINILVNIPVYPYFIQCLLFFDCIPELFSITSEIILNKHCQLICDQSSTIYNTIVCIVLDVRTPSSFISLFIKTNEIKIRTSFVAFWFKNHWKRSISHKLKVEKGKSDNIILLT